MTTELTDLPLPKYFSKHEVAAILGVSDQKIVQMRKDGTLGYIKLSYKTFRFSADHIADYFESVGDSQSAKRVRDYV